MSDIIRLLPDSVANQIAAGEVIQRPASVVKELVENAVDAGATRISVIIRDAGRTLIQVVDDGKGMSDTDARMAFERHATSKISEAADLFALRTMGFRGEALASIVAIATVDLKTRREEDTLGTHIVISGSKVELQEAAGCSKGSNFQVKNLFFNVPARRKFLKKDSVEFSNVVKEFERLALVNPDVELSLIHNDITIHQLIKGTLKQRITALFGKTLGNQILPVATDTALVRLNGYIGLPEASRRRGALQYLFVNGRNMRHPVFHRAIMDCYDNLISPDVQPNYFIDFTVDPDTIDVNIHPTKSEIKFENEAAIRQILVASVRESMGKYNAVPSIDFSVEDVPDIPAFSPNANAEHDVAIDHSYNPFRQSTGRSASVVRSALQDSARDWDKLYADFTRRNDTPVQEGEIESSRLNVHSAESALPIEIEEIAASVSGTFQIRNRYIATPSRHGIMIIDQHRAHLAVLYDEYMSKLGSSEIASQHIMFPESVTLSASQGIVLESLIDSVSALGFELSPLGDNTWSILKVPAVFPLTSPADALLALIAEMEESGSLASDNIIQAMALSMARHSAIKPGRALAQAEIEHLLSSLFKLPTPTYTPDGKLIIATITEDNISRLFK